MPLLFSFHHLAEALVWGSSDAGAAGMGNVAAVGSVVFALVVLPTLVPLAVQLVEPSGRRRRITPFSVLGVMVSGYMVSGYMARALAGHGVTVQEEAHALVYDVGLLYGVATTCTSWRSPARRWSPATRP